MKIGFDASDLCTGRADGTTRYTRELLKRLPDLLREHEVHVFAPCPQPKEFTVSAPNLTWHSSPFPKYWTQARLPFELFRVRPDVLFMPIQQLPIIRPPQMKTISVIHDLAFHTYGTHTGYKDWLLLHTFTAQAARESDHVIAVSHATATDIATTYKRTHNVHVVPHGVDHSRFTPIDETSKEKQWQAVLASYPKLKRPYILYVGQIQPRKNIPALVDGFELLEDRNVHLVVAGGHGWLQESTKERINTSPVKNRIHMIGAVPDAILPALYQNAAAFTLLSLYEGFGIPLLEAMACGIPVVTSNVSSMPEVVGDAGVLVNPNDPTSIAQGLSQALQNSTTLSQKGLKQAQAFTWDSVAHKTVEIIQKLI